MRLQHLKDWAPPLPPPPSIRVFAANSDTVQRSLAQPEIGPVLKIAGILVCGVLVFFMMFVLLTPS